MNREKETAVAKEASTLQKAGEEGKKQLLKARARKLAQDNEKEKPAGESIEVVEFLLAYETYGIESSYVREICPLKDLTPVPCTPPFVLGIINVRGEIVSVIDMKKFFDLPEKGLTDLNKVLVLKNDRMEFGSPRRCDPRRAVPADM